MPNKLLINQQSAFDANSSLENTVMHRYGQVSGA
jgi:hypothetical protein